MAAAEAKSETIRMKEEKERFVVWLLSTSTGSTGSFSQRSAGVKTTTLVEKFKNRVFGDNRVIKISFE